MTERTPQDDRCRASVDPDTPPDLRDVKITGVADSLPELTVRKWRVNCANALLRSLRNTAMPRTGRRRIVQRLVNRTKELCETLTLGFLREGEIHELVDRVYQENIDYYDPQNYTPSLEQDVLPEIQKHATGKRFLDAFCGQGREAAFFASNGFDVTGIDKLEPMIEKARAYAAAVPFDAEFIRADFDHFIASEPFDIVYTSAWMYSTLFSRADRIDFLRRCSALCSASDGIVVVSYHPLPIRPTTKHRIHHHLAKSIGLMTRGNRSVKLGDHLTNGLFWHYVSKSEVEDEVRQAEMKILSRVSHPTGQLDSLVLAASHSIDDCPKLSRTSNVDAACALSREVS